MRRTDSIQVEGRVYHRNPEVDRFQIPLSELGALRMVDVPAHSHLEVLGIPMPPAEFEPEVWIVNGGETASDEQLSIYGGASIPVTPDTAMQAVARLRRAFPALHPYDTRRNPKFSVEDFANRGLKADAFLSLSFEGHGETTVRAALEPFISAFRRLSVPDVQVFICHASEDKDVVRMLVEFITVQGASVWLDEREIKVGDSIVAKISEGIDRASHLVVVLSKHSAAKPWVVKELSSALMRQLGQRSISVLPLRLDDTPLPALLVDVRYADCRTDVQRGFRELLDSVLRYPQDA